MVARSLAVALIAVVAAVAPAHADGSAYPGPDFIGIFTTVDATGRPMSHIDWEGAGYTAFLIHLCLCNLSAGGAGGFECAVEVDDPEGMLHFNSWTLEAGTNAEDTAAGRFRVHYDEPLPPNPQGVVPVATYSGAFIGSEPALIFIRTLPDSEMPDHPHYTAPDDPADLRCLSVPFTECVNGMGASFTFNCLVPDPAVELTWGAVKGLFK